MSEADNNQNSNMLGNRLAKSLLRFLKPIRVAHSRSPGEPKPSHHNPQFKGVISAIAPLGATPPKPADDILKVIENDRLRKNSRLAAPVDGDAESEPLDLDGTRLEKALQPSLASLFPEKTPSHWLDLVLFLINTCKRASVKLRSRKGAQSYQAQMRSKGQSRIKTRGSIIDATTIIEDIEKPEDESADAEKNAAKKTA